MTPQELLNQGPQAALQSAPQGAPQGAQGMEAPGQGMNPGGIEALRNGVRMLMKFMSPEEILDALLKMAQENNINVDEEQLRQIIENETGQASPQANPQGSMPGAPTAAMPPTME